MRWLKRIALVIVALVIAGAILLHLRTYPAESIASHALSSDKSVLVVEAEHYWALLPTSKPAGDCLIYYPGGLVEAEAYAPFLRAVAEAGFPAFLLQLPLNLAVLKPDAADVVKRNAARGADCTRYVIAGHSLGGVMAASYVAKHPEDDLLLIASYPMDSADLSQREVQVVSVSASNDGLSTPEKIDARKHLLPDDTRHVRIAGGNHAQFGWYGPQEGDGAASIDRAQQQALLLDATLALLRGAHCCASNRSN